MDYQPLISRFAGSAKEFCAWVEGVAGANEVFEAIRLVSRLHADAVMLPGVDDEDLPKDGDVPEVSLVEKNAAVKRFGKFPFQYYREVFSPITQEPEEPVCGDIVDDFSDIYCDLKSGLLAYELGREPQAVWHWRFTWRMHWGEHATSALRALHSYQKNNL